MKGIFARIHNGLAWILFAGSILQFFLISLTVFGVSGTGAHANGGRALMLVALLLVIVALIIRVSKVNVFLSLLVFLLLFPGQGMLAYAEIPGQVRALHSITGLLILGLSYTMANGFARAVAPESETAAEAIRASSAAD